MQLGDTSVLEISSLNEGKMAVAATAAAPESTTHHNNNNGDDNSGGDNNSGGDIVGMDVDGSSGEGNNEGNKMSFGGNRWPRQETLALLKIRLDMDSVFRDSSLKGPLWEEVSRKLAELGYHRSAKKCKEKFENVYKYNKRTKENKSGKSHGKTYKFFDQLQALENQFTVSNNNPPKPQPLLPTTTTNTLTLPTRPSDHGNNNVISYVTPLPSTNPALISPSPQTTTSTTNPRQPSPPQTNTNTNNINDNVPLFLLNMNPPFSTSTSTSSSTASDEDLEERYRRKRKWKDYFRRLTKKVLSKQEEMQKKFLEAMDQRERERVAQQENWRMQEMARINREHEILVQERSTAAAKDAAVIALLQKLCSQQNPTHQVDVEPQQHMQTVPQTHPPTLVPNNNFEITKINNGHNAGNTAATVIAAAVNATAATTSPVSSSSSRWPKAEVHALIRLRTSLDNKYQENGPKAPLWEDISIAMQRLGYNRSAKRCKEKWENINKYFKKVRESNKERREDSKTCPYFHELDALYKEKSKSQNPFGMFQNVKPNEMMMMEPLMVQPEQQWRPPPQEGIEKENESEEFQEKDENGDDDDDVDVGDGDSVEDEIATNN